MGEPLRLPEATTAPMSSPERRAEHSLEYYASLPYHLTVVRDAEDTAKPWTASVDELPDCTGRGRTAEEALAAARTAMSAWLETAVDEGREIPEPRSAASHSGRLLLRMPRTLHAELTRASEREGVSLNQFITDVLAGAVVWRSRPGATGPRTPAGPIQTPGAEGLTAELSAATPPRRDLSRFVPMALAANFVVVGVAGIVAVAVLIAAWL
jgi:predicted RNase H-like HicB family nuclease